jgi:hypothetical protein
MTNNDFFPNCYLSYSDDMYLFNGIIASHRLFNYKNGKSIRLFIGVKSQKYIQVNIANIKYFNHKYIGIKGRGKPLNDFNKKCDIIEAIEFQFY